MSMGAVRWGTYHHGIVHDCDPPKWVVDAATIPRHGPLWKWEKWSDVLTRPAAMPPRVCRSDPTMRFGNMLNMTSDFFHIRAWLGDEENRHGGTS